MKEQTRRVQLMLPECERLADLLFDEGPRGARYPGGYRQQAVRDQPGQMGRRAPEDSARDQDDRGADNATESDGEGRRGLTFRADRP